MHGPWFVQGDWVRDLAALNKMELLPWDCWGLGDIGPQAAASAQDMALLDRVAVLTLADVGSFPEMRALHESDDRLRVPPVIKSYTDAGAREIKIADE